MPIAQFPQTPILDSIGLAMVIEVYLRVFPYKIENPQQLKRLHRHDAHVHVNRRRNDRFVVGPRLDLLHLAGVVGEVVDG